MTALDDVRLLNWQNEYFDLGGISSLNAMCVRGSGQNYRNGDESCTGEDWFVTRRLDGVEIVMLWQLIMWQCRRRWLGDATNRQMSFGLDRGSSCSGGTACTDRSEPSWSASRHLSPVSIPEKIKGILVKVFEVRTRPCWCLSFLVIWKGALLSIVFTQSLFKQK